MDRQKLGKIVDVLQGITYQEWKNLKRIVDEYFRKKADKQNDKIMFIGTMDQVEEYTHNFSPVQEESEVNNYFAGNGEIKRVKDTK